MITSMIRLKLMWQTVALLLSIAFGLQSCSSKDDQQQMEEPVDEQQADEEDDEGELAESNDEGEEADEEDDEGELAESNDEGEEADEEDDEGELAESYDEGEEADDALDNSLDGAEEMDSELAGDSGPSGEIQQVESFSSPSSDARVMYIKAGRSNVYQTQNAEGASLRRLDRGDHVVVVLEGEWARVTTGGYIQASQLSEAGVGRVRTAGVWN
jgi:hypothetical protein